MNLESVLDRTRMVLRRKHLAWRTEEAYCHWIRRFARFVCNLPKELSSEEKVEHYLTSIARKGCSASTQNQAFNAILFLYKEVLRKPLLNIQALRARRPQRVRTAPSRSEVARLLSDIETQEESENDYPIKLIVKLLYGCGLRVSEPLNLRLKDVDLENSRLVIRDAKGGKDRVVPLPGSLTPVVQEQIKRAQKMWMKDRQKGVPVPLPDALSRKYPRAEESLGWYWLFPAHQPCIHPRTGRAIRWRAHEVNVQRAVRRAAKECGLDSVVTPHVLRHACATHSLQQGVNVRDVQEVMGHASLETTMRYLHTSADRLRSPLETLPVEMLPVQGVSVSVPARAPCRSDDSTRICSEAPIQRCDTRTLSTDLETSSKRLGTAALQRQRGGAQVPSMGPGTPSMGLGTPSMGLGTPSMELGTPSMELGTPSMGLGTPSMGLGTPSMGLGTPSMGLGTPSMGLGTPSMGLGTPSMGLGSPSMGLGSPSMGLGSPSMGLGAPSMGLGSPSIGLGSPSMGLGSPSIGLGSPSMGLGSPSMGLGAPSMGLGAPSMGLGTPSMGLGTPSMGLGTPSMGLGTPSMGLGTPSMEIGAPSMGLGAPSVEIGHPTMEPGDSFGFGRCQRFVMLPEAA